MIEAFVTLRGSGSAVSRDRIALLAAVADEGSIAGGARAVGLTYKAAWDALQAMTRLFGHPLLDRRVGGRAGGGTRLTPAGAHVIAAFGRLEADLARAARQLDSVTALAGTSDADVAPLRTSARNVLRGTIAAVRPRDLSADVALALTGGGTLEARITMGSVAGLGLAIGRPAAALVKAPLVRLTAHDGARSARDNAFVASILTTTLAGVAAEIHVDIGAGRQLAAATTARHARRLGLEPGSPVLASFNPIDVILAVD